jgi:putative glutamate/gamma-aminobutyrate antiporter
MNQKKSLTVGMIALMNVAAVTNIKNFPLLAQYGWSVLFFLVLSGVCFFIPVALVSAELASAWPQRGVYTWVREALGPRWAFFAIWLQWIENVIWYPTVLIFIASTAAYLFSPENGAKLANHKPFVISMILITFWPATFLNFFGMKVSGSFSSLTAVLGTIVPMTLIVFLSSWWVFSGQPTNLHFSWDKLFPDLTSQTQLILFSGVLLGLAGMEMSSVHAKEVENPRKNYPKAILLSALFILLFSGIGALAIAAIVPNAALANGAMQAFETLFYAFGIPWAVPLIAAVMTIGAIGMMSTWIVGPSRGLFETAEQGDLPAFFHKTNHHGMPINILLTQAVIVTVLTLFVHLLPSINCAYIAFVALASVLYMMMYVLLFVSALILRYKYPNTHRSYQVPGGKKGLWIICSMGVFGSSLGIILGLLPPIDLSSCSVKEYESLLIGGTLILTILPLLLYHHRKPHWKKEK